MYQTLLKKLKGCAKSWTIWLNTLFLIALPVSQYAFDNYQQLQPFLGEETYKFVGLAVVVANIVLRFKTSASLSEK